MFRGWQNPVLAGVSRFETTQKGSEKRQKGSDKKFKPHKKGVNQLFIIKVLICIITHFIINVLKRDFTNGK